MPGTSDRTVLVILHEKALGGASLSVLRLVPLLRERGWSFVFWVARPSELYDHLVREGHEVHGQARPVAYGLRTLRLPPGPLRRTLAVPAYFAALARVVRELRPAVVHANSLFSLAEATAARLAGGRVLLYVHELVPAGWKGAAATLAARAIASERVAVSEASARTFGGPDGVRVVFGGTEVPAEAVELRREPSPFVVGTIGPVGRNKGSDVFVEAARLVQARRPDVRFRLVGALRDPVEPAWGVDVVERARALGVEHVEWVDVPQELRGWDAFALPSRIDAFPGVMLQAMALGLPVIGSEVGGIPEQVDGCGLLVAPDDPQALADAVLELAGAAYQRRVSLGASARERVIERFTLERQAAALDAAYRAAAG